MKEIEETVLIANGYELKVPKKDVIENNVISIYVKDNFLNIDYDAMSVDSSFYEHFKINIQPNPYWDQLRVCGSNPKS